MTRQSDIRDELDKHKDITNRTGTVFNKRQLQILEQEFGTWESVGKAVSPDATMSEICMIAGRQQVLDYIRKLVM